MVRGSPEIPGSQGVHEDPESSGESFGPGAKWVPPDPEGVQSVRESPDPREKVHLVLESGSPRISGGKRERKGAKPGLPVARLPLH